ncbi:tRNA (adenosine(37)-N6)-dimethylallyltransferase MiaA [Akkermansia sp.]|uniref:tRNA (adenosine(37)-N6)-dimethylallyltransferase MiaA n=1 Tax=Akkermansia sp. TaxID=1872421 RepID=UPI0025C20B22|nr:tRNA (adenosine(37)-N6)-dimethylallyltransferase MiaA [Akkermansia sp.]MCD8064306.1 tRNA (adenosine(37)-N6)-dimethylallyltransferase MiaA [Akkermansia sp.]
MPGISTTGLPATLFLAGPTGSGKSAVAVELAEMLGAEIVSSDAYQVYRELPILTAAPSPEDRARVPHHMVSIIPARMPWDATEHYHRAMRCVKDIHARGKTAIVTGGSGLYFKFLSHGMSEAPPGDAALRAAFADCSTEELHARLASLDPEGAAATDPSNRRYVERNLEIVLAGGKPLSFWKRNWLKPPPGPGWAITRDVPELDGRIALRAARMMQEGAVEEAAALGPCSATAERTLGLALIRSLLRGEITRETCQSQLALATRQYAKRQRTWLKREQWLRELPASPSNSPRDLAECIMRELER